MDAGQFLSWQLVKQVTNFSLHDYLHSNITFHCYLWNETGNICMCWLQRLCCSGRCIFERIHEAGLGWLHMRASSHEERVHVHVSQQSYYVVWMEWPHVCVYVYDSAWFCSIIVWNWLHIHIMQQQLIDSIECIIVLKIQRNISIRYSTWNLL